MTLHDQLQIEMAANGSVSGRLREWPALDAALRRQDIYLHPMTLATTLKTVCIDVLKVERLLNITEPIGNCDGSGRYAFDPAREDGHGALLAKPCPGCRACR